MTLYQLNTHAFRHKRRSVDATLWHHRARDVSRGVDVQVRVRLHRTVTVERLPVSAHQVQHL